MKSSFYRRMVLLGCIATSLSMPLYANTAFYEASTSIEQQEQTLRGVVLDAKTNEPIIGANIYCKETSTGAVTDIDGNYQLKAPVGAKLSISYIGYTAREVVATAGQQVIKLSEDSEMLDEIVVVGYGVQKKESLTGSMQVLKSDKITDITTPSVENMLSSKSPGVYVSGSSGRPGDAGAVMIRGKSTINGSTAPLWVIDGVIVGSDAGALNPSDIESMSILKDAASTAIYGSQGANGVILITTKSAKADDLQINFSAKAGFSRLNNGRLKMMNGAELYDYFASFPNQEDITFDLWRPELRDQNFNWWDLATQTGVAQDYNLSISGGTEKMKSFFSLGIYDEEGAVKGYDYRRYNFRYKTDYKPWDFLTIKPNASGSRRKIHDQQYSVSAMYSNLPWDSPYDEDGNIVDHKSPSWVNSNSTNYLKDIQWNYYDNVRYEFTGGVDFDVKLTDYLTFVSTNNYKWTNTQYTNYTDPRSYSGQGVDGRLEEYQYTTTRRYTNQLLRFNKMFGKHMVSALAAYEFNDFKGKTVTATGTGFIPEFEILDVVAIPEKTKGGISEWAVKSMLFKGNYEYDNRYLAEVSLRRDGASNFGSDKKYGNFFSVSGGWNMHRENWFKLDWMDELKLRASYGSVGNRPNSLYPQYDLYSVSSSYDEVPGALISQIGNKKLTWEKTFTTGIGIDTRFLDRINFSFDYYYKFTDNLLYRVPVSGITGVTGVWRNVGEMSNRGVEMILGADIIRNQDWYWNVSFNIGSNKNKVKKLYGDKAEMIVGDGGINIAGAANKILKPGYDSDTYYIVEWAGVNPENGDPQWYKSVKQEDGTVTREKTNRYDQADKVLYKSSAPKAFGGFSTDLSYKNIDFNMNFGFAYGGKIYNYSRSEYDADGAYTDRNQMKLKKGWKRWEKPGDIATHPLAKYENKSASNKASSRFIESGTFLKLRSLSLGYNLQLPQYYIKNMRIFFTAENLFTITPYSGVDPELPAVEGGAVGTAGPSVYPSTRKFMFGLNFTL